MGISDERFKELLEGKRFNTTTADGEPFDEKELFLERIDDELNKWFFDSDYLDDIDTYFSKNIRNIDAIIKASAGGAATKFAVLANPIYGNKAITAEEIEKLFSDLKNEDAIETKRKILFNIINNNGNSYPGITDDLALAIDQEIGKLSVSQGLQKQNALNAGATYAVNRKNIDDALSKITPPPDDTSVTPSLPESITSGFTKQCILMANIGTLYDHYYDKLYDQVKPLPGEGQELAVSGKYLYGGNIVPINIKNPEYLIPFMTSPRQLYTGFLNGFNSKLAFNNNLNNNIEICFVKKINGEVHEFPLISSNKSPDNDYNSLIKFIEASNLATGQDTKEFYRNSTAVAKAEYRKQWIESQDGNGAGNVYKFDSFDISFEGTNPSTARNDVKVKLSFTLTNLNVINKLETLSSKQDDTVTQSFSLADLVKYPFYDNEASGGGKLFRSQYDPNHNRIRIYLSTNYVGDLKDLRPENQLFLRDNVLALDLTLIDHEFSKSGEGMNTAVTYTVNYRGYSESLLATPLMDALVSKQRMQERIDREEILKKAVTENCSLSEVQKIIGELNAAAAAEAGTGYGRIFDNLSAGGRIYQVSVDSSQTQAITNIYRPPTEEEKKDGKKAEAPSTAQVAQAANLSSGVIRPSNYSSFKPGFDESGANQIYFFYLFDLLDVITDNLYTRSAGTGNNFTPVRAKESPSQFVVDNNHRFFLGPISVPIYNNATGNITRKLINLGNLPISVEYFNEWYKENVTDKELSFFPITSFLRQIFERLVTNMLHEFCFNDNLDSKVLIRTSIFEDSKYTNSDGTEAASGNTISEAGYYGLVNKFFWNKRFFDFDDNWDFANTTSVRTLQPLFQTDPKTGIRSGDKKPTTCIVVYAQGRSDVYSTDLITKMETDATMAIVDVTNPDFSWYLKNWSFSRVSQQGLREARYFNSSLNSITQLAAVYDITLTFTKVIPTIFPGQIFKVLLNELGAVPSDPNGLPYQLGLGGYHLITKVSHAYSTGAIYDPQITTSITMRWFSSGSKQELLRQVLVDTKISDPAQAITDAACDELTKYAQEISSQVIQDAQIGGLGASNITEQTVEERFNDAAEATAQNLGVSLSSGPTVNPYEEIQDNVFRAFSLGSYTNPSTGALYEANTNSSGDLVVTVKDSAGEVTATFNKNGQIIEE